MLRAAARGLIDFRRRDPLCVLWRRHVDLILTELHEQQALEWTHCDYEYLLADWQRPLPRTPTGQHELQRRLQQTREQLFQQLQSYRPDNEDSARPASLASELRAEWVREFGDPDDPAVRAQIDATAAALRRTRGT